MFATDVDVIGADEAVATVTGEVTETVLQLLLGAAGAGDTWVTFGLIWFGEAAAGLRSLAAFGEAKLKSGRRRGDKNSSRKIPPRLLAG